MERGTRDERMRMEGNAQGGGGGESEEDIFGFGAKSVTEQQLLNMRRVNEENARRAMASLKGKAYKGLPAIYGSGSNPLSVQQSVARKAGAARAKRTVGNRTAPRSMLSNEVREAAEMELQEMEDDLSRPSSRAQSRAGEAAQTTASPSPARRVSLHGRAKKAGPEPLSAEAEATLMFRLLDWQKEVRNKGIPVPHLLGFGFNPRALFDKELKAVSALVRKQNEALKEYLESAKSKQDPHEAEKYAVTVSVTEVNDMDVDGGVGEAGSMASGRSSNFGPGPRGREKRERREREKKAMQAVAEGAAMRETALAILRGGGAVAAVRLQEDDSLEYSEEDLRSMLDPGAKNTMLLLHGMLESGMTDPHPQPTEQASTTHLRRMLVSLKAQMATHPANPSNLKRKRALREKRKSGKEGAGARARRRTRERVWEGHVIAYSSLSGEESTAEEEEEAYSRTIALLNESEMWAAGGAAGEDATLLEARLEEMRKRNRLMARMASREAGGRSRTQTPLFASAMAWSDEDFWGDHRSRTTTASTASGASRPSRARKSAYRAPQGAPAGGWFPERGRRGESTERRQLRPATPTDESEGALSGEEARVPADRERLQESARVGRARSRQARGRARAAPAARDNVWIDALLPSSSEEDGGASRAGSMSGAGDMATPLAQEVMATMALLKRAARTANSKLINKEAVLKHLQGAVGTMHELVRPEQVEQVQARIAREVHAVRRGLSAEVKGIFKHIAEARAKMARAKEVEDEETKRVLKLEAQKLLIEAESRASELRKQYTQHKGAGVREELMPQYLVDFLHQPASAQVMYDRGRIQAMQDKAVQEEREEEKRREREKRRRKYRKKHGIVFRAHSSEEDEEHAPGLMDLDQEERGVLTDAVHEMKRLNAVLFELDQCQKDAASADPADLQAAGDKAEKASKLLQESLAMAKAIRKQLKGPRGRRLKSHLPDHVTNLLKMPLPLMQLWKEGWIEPAVCRALTGLAEISASIAQAKQILYKYDAGHDLDDDETELAATLLEGALVDSVGVRERARAAMLDRKTGGEEVGYARFPRHVQNLISNDESVIVLWEKGLVDPSICKWLSRMNEINQLLARADKLRVSAATESGTMDGLDLLKELDDTMYEADTKCLKLRGDIRDALRKNNVELNQLPPHLQNLLHDDRPLAFLHKEGKLDPLMALFEQHASTMRRRRKESETMKRRAAKLMDAENRRAMIEEAQDLSHSTMKQMLQMRAKILLGGLDPAQLPLAVQETIEEAEEAMEAGDVDMDDALAELGISQELVDRLRQRTVESEERSIVFHQVDWDGLEGLSAAQLELPTAYPAPREGVSPATSAGNALAHTDFGAPPAPFEAWGSDTRAPGSAALPESSLAPAPTPGAATTLAVGTVALVPGAAPAPVPGSPAMTPAALASGVLQAGTDGPTPMSVDGSIQAAATAPGTPSRVPPGTVGAPPLSAQSAEGGAAAAVQMVAGAPDASAVPGAPGAGTERVGAQGAAGGGGGAGTGAGAGSGPGPGQGGPGTGAGAGASHGTGTGTGTGGAAVPAPAGEGQGVVSAAGPTGGVHAPGGEGGGVQRPPATAPGALPLPPAPPWDMNTFTPAPWTPEAGAPAVDMQGRPQQQQQQQAQPGGEGAAASVGLSGAGVPWHQGAAVPQPPGASAASGAASGAQAQQHASHGATDPTHAVGGAVAASGQVIPGQAVSAAGERPVSEAGAVAPGVAGLPPPGTPPAHLLPAPAATATGPGGFAPEAARRGSTSTVSAAGESGSRGSGSRPSRTATSSSARTGTGGVPAGFARRPSVAQDAFPMATFTETVLFGELRCGIDCSAVQPQALDTVFAEDGSILFGGVERNLPGLATDISGSSEWPADAADSPADPNMSNLPVFDDVHPKAEGVQALEVIEDVTDFEGPMDANMTETDFEGGASTEGGETGTRVPKKYDSDDDDEPQRLARKKKAKNVAKGVEDVEDKIDEKRLLGKMRAGVPLETRRKILEMIQVAKRTLKIDISNLGLPYFPKQVLDCVYLDQVIADHNLLDEVDPALGHMGNLRVLSLSYNRIEGPLPLSLWELNVLRTLHLDHNQIDDIPGEIHMLSSLTKLRLDTNNLDTIPAELGQRTNMKYLSLDRNNLKELPIQLRKMAKLSTLTLSRNLFVAIPKCVFQMGSLKVLHVHHNQIPAFPPELEMLKKLSDLNFGANLLLELPTMISRLTTLQKFDFSKNEIRELGPEIAALTNLTHLAFGHNLIQHIPEELSAVRKLKKLSVNSNRLTYLPENLTFLTTLQVLDLRNNFFIALAPQIGRMSTLTSLRVDGNDLKTPPPYVCDKETKAMLRFLDRLDQAIVTGEMDLARLSVPKERILEKKGNRKYRTRDKYKIIPEVPVFLQDFRFPHGWYTGCGLLTRALITSLNLAGNGLKALQGEELQGNRATCMVPHLMYACKVPDESWEVDPLTNLQSLQLQANRLVSLPAELHYLTALTFLDLSSNSLEVLAGEHFGVLTNMEHLDLSNNPRLKILPHEMGTFVKLEWLSVEGCLLTSPPPVIVQRGCKPIVRYLRQLHDAHSTRSLSLDGEWLQAVSHDIYEMSRLTYLSVARNNLSMLPPELGGVVALRTLCADQNYLMSLPATLSSLTALTHLSLSRNLLQTLLPDPALLLSLGLLSTLDISYNQFKVLPVELCTLTALTALSVQGNRLPTLPFEVHRLTNLTKLDARNNVLRLPLKDLAEDPDIGVLLEFFRTLINARGDTHPQHTIPATHWLDLSRRPYKVLPQEVCSITALEVLKLKGSGLEFVPLAISSLGRLSVLELQDNSLHALPDGVSVLTELTLLSLSRNWLARMPYCLSTLENLTSLHMDGNQLTVVMADIRKLTALTELSLSENCIRQLTPAVAGLTNLAVLDLSGNQLSFVPTELALMTDLRRLSLRCNYITELPTELHVLAEGNMIMFDISDNGMKSPPPEVVIQGNDAIFDYLRRFHEARASSALDLSDMCLSYLPVDVMRFFRTEGTACFGLKRLILDGNNMSWLPNYLRTMTTLTHLSLKWCNFTKLPYFIGDLQNLTRIDLEGNDIVSPPAEIVRRGVNAMVKYMRGIDSAWWTKDLDISGQRFETVPLEICDVDSLTSLKMHSQNFSDIPEEIGRLTALNHLNLQYCALVELPDSIGALFHLRELILNNNRLVSLPPGIGACTALTDFRLHENQLESLPREIGNLTLMQDLRLFNNNLLELPMEVGHMRYLPAFRISSNQLPDLTVGIGGLDAVTDLLIADNYLEGLPPQIGLLTNITRLRVTRNRLASLPKELCNLYNMTELAVSHNNLTQLPPLGYLTALRNLIVANNPITKPPDTIIRKGTFAIVNYLRVQQDSGGAPPEVVARGMQSVSYFHELMEKGRHLAKLSLRACMLLALPDQVPDMHKITELDLECNVMETLEEGIGLLSELRVLKISYNQLRALPASMAMLSKLEVFEAKYNFLTLLPECIVDLPLRTLCLDSNELQELPACMKRLTALTLLSLSNNTIRKISDEVPTGLGNLVQLFLQQNELMLLPDTIDCMTSLQEVNLSFNHLYQLPYGVSALTRVTALHLSYNDLTASSLSLDTMKDLFELGLTSNRLTGIPHTFALLTQLRSLQVGGNMFPVEPSQQHLKTWEMTQKWLKINLQNWAAAEAEKNKSGPSMLLRSRTRKAAKDKPS